MRNAELDGKNAPFWKKKKAKFNFGEQLTFIQKSQTSRNIARRAKKWGPDSNAIAPHALKHGPKHAV